MAGVLVIGIPDEKNGEEVMAFVVKMPGQEFSADDISAFAKDKMTSFKAPAEGKFVDGLPKSLVEKVLKKELRKLV